MFIPCHILQNYIYQHQVDTEIALATLNTADFIRLDQQIVPVNDFREKVIRHGEVAVSGEQDVDVV